MYMYVYTCIYIYIYIYMHMIIYDTNNNNDTNNIIPRPSTGRGGRAPRRPDITLSYSIVSYYYVVYDYIV